MPTIQVYRYSVVIVGIKPGGFHKSEDYETESSSHSNDP